MNMGDIINSNNDNNILSVSPSSPIDNDFFAQLVDDLFLDNDFFTFPTSSHSSEATTTTSINSSSISNNNNNLLSQLSQSDSSIQNDLCLSPNSPSDDSSNAPLAYPAPAPLAIVASIPEVSHKRSRELSNADSLQNAFDNFSSDQFNAEKAKKKMKEKAEVVTQIEVSKPKKNFIGVTYHAPSNRFRARIKIENKTTHLGYFTTEYEAAVAYDRAAWELRGTKAHLNFDFPTEMSFANQSLPIRERCIAAAKSAAGIVQSA